MNANANEPILIYQKEERYYVLALIFSIIVYLALFFSIIFMLLIPILVVIPLIAQAIMMANIRMNGVRITPRQFPEVFAVAEEQCAKMGFTVVPDLYVMESSGILNAFASRFFGRNMVVLYADLFELIQSGGERELAFVLTHELAHIKRNHIMKQLFIIPAMWLPFLGEAYSRACEYTCDRMAAYYIDDAEAAMNGLTILAIGKTLYRRVDREEYLLQSSYENGFFVWLAERLSTHPPLPKRIHALQQFAGYSSSIVFHTSRIGIVIAVAAVFVLLGSVSTGIIFSKSIATFMSQFEDGANAEEELLGAALEGDADLVRQLLSSGVNPDAADAEGWTALMWAAQLNDTASGSAIIDAGADLNLFEHTYEETALTIAIYNGSVDVVELLLEGNANPDLQDSTGWTPLMTAATEGDMESTKLLLQAGADPLIVDETGYTAADYAMDSGFEEIARLLQETGKRV
ncbi:Zn-dependent protease with chaperone function [Paenibacillus endophyticus]|uniref:Zn-dependent protease with chaperone function n=1 Tax=Paenibacillus endophyticus TaxID=1294268 RepID=A0A7W5GA98_9BACL|nr:ankyrin repeat domain-containing protein [Paenibacillus endophyticus]MBB3153009.1 Zn-dependent protease with chaperone function [Paenibacillus endophyticus]